MLDEGCVGELQELLIQPVIGAKSGKIDRVTLERIDEGCEKFMHSLTVASAVWIGFAVDEEDVGDHVLDALMMVVDLVGESLDVLSDLGANNFILSDCVPW